MNPKTTITLAILMFCGLGAYWWTQFAKVPTADELRPRSFLVLPELADVPATEIARIEIDGGDKPIVVERAGKSRWELVAPVKALADSKRVETLLGYVYTLRKSFDAGTLTGSPSKYGLDKPERVVRLFRQGDKTPAAALEVGKVFEAARYVRPLGRTNIEVVNARALDLLNAKTFDWREQQMFTISPLDISAVRIQGTDRNFEAPRGHQVANRPTDQNPRR